MDMHDDSSSCSIIEIDDEEEETASFKKLDTATKQKTRKKRKRTPSSKEDELIIYSAESSDDQSNIDSRKKKKNRKKLRKENLKKKENSPSKRRKGNSGKVEGPGPSSDNGSFGFESESIFSQFAGDKNETNPDQVDSVETVLSGAETEAEEESYPRVPSLNLDIADEEMEANTILPKPTIPDIVSVTKTLKELQQKSWTFRSRLSEEIKDKEFLSDQEFSSSDDDTPLLQLNIAQGTRNNAGLKLHEITDNSKVSPVEKTNVHSEKQSELLDVDCELDKHMGGKSSEAKHISNDGFGRNDGTESEDETQPFEEYDLPDLSPPPHQEEQSIYFPNKRENSPEIFKDVEDPTDQGNLYTQIDDCIYIQDSEEEELSQSLFQQEVNLELDESSDDEAYVKDEEEESWREILSLDESDEDTDVTDKEMSKSDDTSESAQKLKLTTKCNADPYALATQVNTDDLYTSSTQIISKDSLYKSETQADTSDHYTRDTQISKHNLFSSKSDDDDIYNTATQIDKHSRSGHKNDNYHKAQAVCSELPDKVDSNSSVTLLYRRDLYSSATQVDCSKHSVTERKIVKTDRNSQEQKKLDPYLCATQHDSTSNSPLDDQGDLYLEATQVDGPSSFAPEIVEKRTSSSDELDNNERDLYFEPTQKERTELDPYDVATQVDSQPDGNYGPEIDSEYDDDFILLTDTESVTSDELTSAEKENEMEVSTGNQLSRNQGTGGKMDTGNSTKVMEISSEPGSACDKKSEPGRISDKRDQGEQDQKDRKREEQKDRKREERNVFQDLYMMETQIDDSVKHLQNTDVESSESWSDMELYECATQIDSISEPLQLALIEGKSTDALKKMDQSMDNYGPSTCTTVAGTSDRSSLPELETNPLDESRSSDPASSDLEILSDSASTKKTWVNTQNYREKQQQRNTISRESDFLSLKMKSTEHGTPARNTGHSDIDQSSHPPPMLKQVAQQSSVKPAILIPAQPHKSTKEKREEFKINSFYSKKSLNQETLGKPVQLGNRKATGTSVQNKPSTVTEWLSKASGKSRDRKRPSKASSRGGNHAKKRKDDATSNVNLDALINAKAAMYARKWVKPFLPEPVKKPSIDTKTSYTDDVTMPELDEVMKRQLPLMDDGQLLSWRSNQAEEVSDRSVNDASEWSEFTATTPSTLSGGSSASTTAKNDRLKETPKQEGLKGCNIQGTSEEMEPHENSGSRDRHGSKDSGHRQKDNPKIIPPDASKSEVNAHLHKDSYSAHKYHTTVLKEKNSSRKPDSRDGKSFSRSSTTNRDGVLVHVNGANDMTKTSVDDSKGTSFQEQNLREKEKSSAKHKKKNHSQCSDLKNKGEKINDDKNGLKKSGSHHSKRSSSKDKEHSKTSCSTVDRNSEGSCSKDKDHLRRSSSREKEHSKRSSSKEKDDSRKCSSRDRDDLRKTYSKDSDKSRKSSSRDSDNTKKSSLRDADKNRKSSSRDSDKSKSSSKHNLEKSRSKQDETSKSSNSKDILSLGDSSISLSRENQSERHASNDEMLDVSESAENVSKRKIETLCDRTLDRNREESSSRSKMESLTSMSHVNILDKALENCDQIHSDPEEDMEDVKLGKLAKAAAFEKRLPSSQDQLEDDDPHVIIIDDDEETMEDKMESRHKEIKDAMAIKPILKKDFLPFFADRNDESRRKGQRIKFKLASDRVSERTQRYINSLLQKNKNVGKVTHRNEPSGANCPPPSNDAKSSNAAVAKPQILNKDNSQVPPRVAALSSMHTSCVTVPSRGGQAHAVGSAGTTRAAREGEEDYCSQFFKQLLKWNSLWFSEAVKKDQRRCYEPPPVSGNVYPIPEKFNSYKDYVNIFIPHLLQEAWEQSYQSWKQMKSLKSYPQIGAVYSGVERNSSPASSNLTYEKYTWYSVISKEAYNAMRKQDHLGEKFLVIIKDYGHYLKSKERPMEEKFYHPNYFDQIGYIEKIQPHSRRGSLEQTINTFKVLGTDPAARQKDAVILCITVLSKRRPLFKHLLNKLSYIQPIGSLVTIVRQFQAVSSLPRSPVCQHILLPGQQDVFYEKVTISDSMKQSLKRFNESQRLAICTASQMILGNPRSPKIGLLHGPPGTGKSSTVVAIVEKVLTSLGSNVRICLCAPSNNAVDLLIKRLDDHKNQTNNIELSSALSIVRIGNAESIHRDVKKFSLSEILQKESFKLKTEKKKENIPQSVLENYNDLKDRLKTLTEQWRQCQGKKEEEKRLSADIEKIEKRVADMEKDHFKQINDVSLSRAEENNLKRAILQRATVVCGTLSAFGQPFISDLLRHSAGRGKPVFDCVIVDEASQANELDCIIPLQYQVNKLILVGDPEQLPPTITSRKAAQNYFGQSLFERFYRHFQSCKTNVSPVLMLDTQYRMHPDIAYWPSEYIYQGKLKTDHSVISRCRQTGRLKPFLLFDVQDSQEALSQTTGSVSNPTEVEFIVQLVMVILETGVRPRDVGIIAPYKNQKHLLSSSLARKGVRNIEISTVDGFQGQEKEVIVFSCVRAKNQSRSIGFMADKKRMNVALTRAKSALYIAAHLDSLKEADVDWRNMIEDARRRHLIRTVPSGGDFSRAGKQILT